jgi:hypothetical protein
MRSGNLRAFLALFVFGLGLTLTTAYSVAQQTLGSITGTVTDASNAVVPRVQITATNTGTGGVRSVRTSNSGTYTFQDLPTGVYSLSFVHDGFETENFPSVQVQADRTGTVNVRLSTGSVTSSVEVTATPLLNATDTTNGYVLDSAQIQATPLGTGSFTQLALLSPGANADFLSDTGTNYNFGAPPTNFDIGTAFAQTNQQIGIIQHALGSPRQVQFAGKLTF